MDFDSIVLIHKQNGKFINEGFSITIERCFSNIKSFYEENGKIFLVLNLEQDFSDEEFYNIIENLNYEEFESLGVKIYPKDDEYYPTFLIEMTNSSREDVQDKVYSLLELFEDKVVKIYCNNL